MVADELWVAEKFQSNPEIAGSLRKSFFRSQTVGDKFHRQKGNSPDPQLRSQIIVKWRRMWDCIDNQDVGLEAATH